MILKNDCKGSKYGWIDRDFDNYLKKQAEALRKLGIQSNTAGVTRLLLNRVLVPNDVKLEMLFKKKLRLKKR